LSGEQGVVTLLEAELVLKKCIISAGRTAKLWDETD